VADDDHKADGANRAAWIGFLGAILAAIIGVLFTPLFGNWFGDDPAPTTTTATIVTSAPTTTGASAGTDAERACTLVLAELRAERDRLNELHGEVRVQNGHVATNQGPAFRTAHQAARAGST
jgi:hypothetical protein